VFSFLRRLFGCIALFLAVSGAVAAPGVEWSFAPQRAGRALHQGGWTQTFTLGEVRASPEFSFPIELVYLTPRAGAGLFGGQWFCPQLESAVLPQAKGVLVWTTPSGGVIALMENPKRRNEFTDGAGTWRADASGKGVVIRNDAGWMYYYRSGRIVSIVSPTQRALNFGYNGRVLKAVQLRDNASGAALDLIRVAADTDGRAQAIEIGGLRHQFRFHPRGDHPLTGWQLPNGDVVEFAYADSGVLSGIKFADQPPIAIKTDYVPAMASGAEDRRAEAKKAAANWWITDDDLFHYDYATNPKMKRDGPMVPDSITLTDRAGGRRVVTPSLQRGTVTLAEASGAERRQYFYRAPGQPYDGRLRRIEENGRVMIEYRYDRKRGLLTEMIDQNGVITFFDYPPASAAKRSDAGEPKPIRVRRGDRRSNQVIAEYACDSAGRVTAMKDAAGQITKFTYTPRGEIASVTDPGGIRRTLTYDALGRVTSAAIGDRKEAVAFDALGRVAARIDADGHRITFERDRFGNVTRTLLDGKLVVESLHDAKGRPTGEKDALGRIRKIERDARGNLLAETAPNGSVTRYEYDAMNRRTAQIDGNGNRITFEYDPSGRLIRQTNPLGGTLTWKYDSRGRLAIRANGIQKIIHVHDPRGRLIKLDYGQPGQSIEFSYDARARPQCAHAGQPIRLQLRPPGSPRRAAHRDRRRRGPPHPLPLRRPRTPHRPAAGRGRRRHALAGRTGRTRRILHTHRPD